MICLKTRIIFIIERKYSIIVYEIIYKLIRKEGVYMSLARELLENFNELSDEKKKEVIDFVEFLKTRDQNNLETMMDKIIEENREALEELSK